MASQVARALEQGSVLLAEAGTGTGKTLAYLVPAILSGQRVVISTATKALQDQIVSSDLRLVRQTMGLDPTVAVAKGLSNYLCLRRFGEARADPDVAREHRRALPLVEAWAGVTEAGDLAELSAVGEDDPLWTEVRSSSETRVGAACPRYDACFVTRMKQSLGRASIIVTNHHLLLADAALKVKAGDAAQRAGVLPPYDALICDEAHRLEDIASELFGLRVSSARVATLGQDATRAFAAAGLGSPLFVRGDAAGLSAELGAAAAAFFGQVGDLARAEDARTLLPRDALSEVFGDRYARLDAALESIALFAETHGTTERVLVVARRATELREELSALSDPPTEHVLWVTRKVRSVVIGAAAISVGDAIRGKVFARVGGVVLTSATLTSVPLARGEGGGTATPFSFVRDRLGLDGGAGMRVEELEVGSPFDYASAALLYVARDLPEPSAPEFLDAAAERVAEIVEASGGGAFVLTTSTRAMRELGARLIRSTGRDVLVQGDAPKGALVARFREHGDAVLVGTMSFWEGVDVPGRALRAVVIDRLPFAAPTDPLTMARCATLEAAGLDPFASYSVPAAAITLKQGAGRLVRTQADRGVVAVLDRRLVTRGYGRKMLERLPMKRLTERLDDVRAFFADAT